MSAKIERFRMMRAKAICSLLGGMDTRTLYEHVKSGRFPPPDRPATTNGEANLWFETTVEHAFEKYVRRARKAVSA